MIPSTAHIKFSHSRIFLLLLSVLLAHQVSAQRFVTHEGEITFFSEAPIENIRATNSKVTSILLDNGNIAVSLMQKDFIFPKKLMQEHFNDKYMESDKFPRATFSGKVSGLSLTTYNQQSVTAKGTLTIHGVSKEVEISGSAWVKNDIITIDSKFYVMVADYDITIPQILWQNIAEKIEVTLKLVYTREEK